MLNGLRCLILVVQNGAPFIEDLVFGDDWEVALRWGRWGFDLRIVGLLNQFVLDLVRAEVVLWCVEVIGGYGRRSFEPSRLSFFLATDHNSVVYRWLIVLCSEVVRLLLALTWFGRRWLINDVTWVIELVVSAKGILVLLRQLSCREASGTLSLLWLHRRHF